MTGQYIAYYRVSTQRQGRSGLGLEAQQEAVRSYLKGTGGELLNSYEERESGRGSNALERRPVLREAMAAAKKAKATLIIAKLDRLARNVHFVSGLMEAKVPFVCCDFPTAEPSMLHIYAAMAEHEGRRIGERIREALAAKKARGGKLGNPATLQPGNQQRTQRAQEFAEHMRVTLVSLQTSGTTQRQIVEELNRLGIKTARGGSWSLVQVQRVLARL